MIKINKKILFHYIAVLIISYIAILLKNPTFGLLVAALQLVIIFITAKISLLTIFSFLINFCLVQEYGAYSGWNVYGILAYSSVPIYYFELLYCTYFFNLVILFVIYFTKYLENEEKLFKTSSIDITFSLSILLIIGAILITILIFPTLPSLQSFTTVNRFSSGILSFTGWSCIPIFFLAVSIMNKKLRKLTIFATAFVLLWYFFHGERVDGIGLLAFLAIKYYYDNKNDKAAVLKIVILGSIAVVILVIIGMIRSGTSEVRIQNILSKILVQETACDVTHVFNCAVDLWKHGNQYHGYTYMSYLVNCIPFFADPYSFQSYIHEYYYTAGGGMFFAESVGNFGIRFAMLFSVAYIVAMSVLIRKTTTYRLLTYTALSISIFRTAWYGLNYSIITILYFAPFIIVVNYLLKKR